MDSDKKIKICVDMSLASATMLELAIQEFVRNGGKLNDGLAVNDCTKEELLSIANAIMEQVDRARGE